MQTQTVNHLGSNYSFVKDMKHLHDNKWEGCIAQRAHSSELCDDLERWAVGTGRGLKREGINIYIQVIHFGCTAETIQHKAVLFQ